MTFGRKIVTAAAALLTAAAMTAAAGAQDAKPSKAPVIHTPEVNMCRSECGAAWVKAQSCPLEPAICRSRAERSYKQCLPDCSDGKSPMTASFAWLQPKKPPVSAPAPTTLRGAPVRADDGPDSTAAVPWVDARTVWEVMPSHTLAPLPHTFVLPPSAYAYAGFTQQIRPFVTQSPGLLKVEVVVVDGEVGVALSTPSGSALASKEAVLKPSAEPQTVYFRVGPETPPVALLVRNRNEGGAPGSVTVRAVTFARLKVLPAGEAERLGALQ